jgi:hypothetical protein
MASRLNTANTARDLKRNALGRVQEGADDIVSNPTFSGTFQIHDVE